MAKTITPEEFVAKCKADPVYFFERCLKVAPKEGGIVRFKLNKEQKLVCSLLWELWNSGEPVRLVVLKARRLGISTLIEAFLYWMTSFHEHTGTLVVSHSLDSAQSILEMAHRFADNDERNRYGVMPAKSKSNRKEIVFENPVWQERSENPGLDSKMMVATADTKTTGRGLTLQGLHCSEVAFWPRADLIAGILEALSNRPKTIGVLESTANGRTGYFYRAWQEAWSAKEKGLPSYWTPIFLSWKDSPDCRARVRDEKKWRNILSDEEQLYGEKHGLDIEQMVWRRNKLNSYEGQGMPPELLLMQEYPLVPEEAFVSTGRQFFDMGAVERMEKNSKDVKYQEGWIEMVHPIVKNRPSNLLFHPRRPLDGKVSYLRVWEPPRPGAQYVIGADVGMGIQGSKGDRSVAYVMRRDTLQFVARIAGQIDPDEFADMLVSTGWYYNEAFLCPENNSIGMAVARNTSSRYPKHAYQIDLSKPFAPTFKWDRPGWHTNQTNRREMVHYLRQLVRDEQIHIWDTDFFDQCADFVLPENLDGEVISDKPSAIQHKHDDHVMAVAITLQANDPKMAGPIRINPMQQVAEMDWRHAATMERPAEVKEIYDEHVGKI